jgi:hypothetical protein
MASAMGGATRRRDVVVHVATVRSGRRTLRPVRRSPVSCGRDFVDEVQVVVQECGCSRLFALRCARSPDLFNKRLRHTDLSRVPRISVPLCRLSSLYCTAIPPSNVIFNPLDRQGLYFQGNTAS